MLKRSIVSVSTRMYCVIQYHSISKDLSDIVYLCHFQTLYLRTVQVYVSYTAIIGHLMLVFLGVTLEFLRVDPDYDIIRLKFSNMVKMYYFVVRIIQTLYFEIFLLGDTNPENMSNTSITYILIKM